MGVGGTARGKQPLGASAVVAKSRGRRRASVEEQQSETATFRSLVDSLFNRQVDKLQVLALFASNKWHVVR